MALTAPAEKASGFLKILERLVEGSEIKGERLIVPRASEAGPERLALAERILTALGG
jgi:hypothetical protein